MEDKSFRELFFRKCAERQGFPFEKAARWKDFGDEGQRARDAGGPVDYLTVHKDPKVKGNINRYRFIDPNKISISRVGLPDGVLSGSKYYPEKGYASDMEAYNSEFAPEKMNKYGFVFNLKPESRIGYINTEDDFNQFFDKYRSHMQPSRSWDVIDWARVAKDLDAVRIGDAFATSNDTDFRFTSPSAPKKPHFDDEEEDANIPIFDAGRIFVLNPSAVAESREWTRNENLHPSNERIDWDEKYEKYMNDYTGPELQGEGDLGKVWGYHVNPGVTDYFSQDMQGGRPLEQPSPAKKKVDTEKKDAGKGAGTGQKKKSPPKKKRPTKGESNTTLDDFGKQPAPVAKESSAPKGPETTSSAPKVTEEQPQKQAPSGFDWSKYKVRLR